MPDREKVVKGFECCSSPDGKDCGNCPYQGQSDIKDCLQLDLDALALLKEQYDEIRILLSDLNDLQKEHEKLLDKKIPLITNGQEVVRCKYCKHRLKCNWWIENGDDWYCADGER